MSYTAAELRNIVLMRTTEKVAEILEKCKEVAELGELYYTLPSWQTLSFQERDSLANREFKVISNKHAWYGNVTVISWEE